MRSALASTRPETIDEYIAGQSAAARPVLETLRRAVAAALPDAKEVISYRIPAFRGPGGIIVWFACWTTHASLYPVGELARARLGEEMAAYKMSKGTIRFPLAEPLPLDLIAAIARLRAEEVAARKAARAPRKR